VPVPVSSLGRSVRSVSADGVSATVCVVTTAGAAKCWGHNSAGNVGNGSMSYAVPTPAQVVGLTSDISSIAVGEGTTCAVRRGALLCWGDGDKGSRASGDQRDSLTPAPAKVLTSGVKQLAMGSMGGCAVKARRAYCWGARAYGQPVSLVPRLVSF